MNFKLVWKLGRVVNSIKMKWVQNLRPNKDFLILIPKLVAFTVITFAGYCKSTSTFGTTFEAICWLISSYEQQLPRGGWARRGKSVLLHPQQISVLLMDLPHFWGKWQKCGFKTTQCSVPYFKVTTQRLDRILLPRLPLWNLLISSSCFVPSLWVQLKNLVSFSTLLSTLLCKNEWFSDIIPHTVAEKSSQKSY